MPCKSFHCNDCNRTITFRKGTMIEAIRRHKKRHHPEKWKKSVKKSSRKRSKK